MLDSETDLKCIDVDMPAWVSLQRHGVVIQDPLITDTGSVINTKWSSDLKSPLHLVLHLPQNLVGNNVRSLPLNKGSHQ
jgi:hypothetical protein